jgi:hypothetical protein
MLEVTMRGEPELDVRCGRLLVSAKGKDAINAIRSPLFAVLFAYAVTFPVMVTLVLLRSEWALLKEALSRWMP